MPQAHTTRSKHGNLVDIYLRYVNEYWWHTIAYFGLLFIAFPIEQIAFPTIYGNIVDLLGKTSTKSLFERTKWYLVGAVLLLILSQVLFTIIDTIDAYSLPALQSFYRETLLKDVFETFQHEFETLQTGNVVSKIVKLPIIVRHIYHQLRNYVLPALIISLCSCIYYTYIDWRLGCLLSVVLIGFYTYAFMRSADCIPSSQARDAKCDKLHEDVDDTLTNLLAVYTHNHVGRELKRFKTKQTKHDALYTKSSLCAVWFKIWFSVFYSVIFIVVNGYAFYLAHKGDISVGSLVSIIFVNLFLIGNIQDFAGEIRDFVFNLGVMAEIQQYLNKLFTKATRTKYKSDKTRSTNLSLKRGHVRFNDVTFRYPGKSLPALKHVSLTIPSQQTVVIVGPIGSGKSTITKLLLRLYTSTSGTVFIDGRNIAKYDPQHVRMFIGYVPQSPTLFDRTLYMNLVYGTTHKTAPSRQVVQQFIQHMGVAPLFQNVQGGLDAYVGKHGEQLSGGQRQAVVLLRLAISDRFGSGPKRTVLLLDEPTAALDAQSKKYVLQLIQKIAKGRTTIIVTHDATVMKIAHRIIRMRDGQITSDRIGNSAPKQSVPISRQLPF